MVAAETLASRSSQIITQLMCDSFLGSFLQGIYKQCIQMEKESSEKVTTCSNQDGSNLALLVCPLGRDSSTTLLYSICLVTLRLKRFVNPTKNASLSLE